MAEEKPLSVYDLIMIMLDQCASVSWQKLGLQHDPVTGALSPDLAEARVAIDLTAYLAQQLEARLDEEDRRRIQSLVRDLRINFVQRNTEGAG
jgi:hypothetical protein